MKYEEALSQLEKILAQLKDGNMPLSDLTAKIKEAQQLVAFCQKCLSDTVTEVEKIITK